MMKFRKRKKSSKRIEENKQDLEIVKKFMEKYGEEWKKLDED